MESCGQHIIGHCSVHCDAQPDGQAELCCTGCSAEKKDRKRLLINFSHNLFFLCL